MITRRQALGGLISMFGASAWSPAQIDYNDPLYGPLNVMDFAALAKAKLDPAAWDYLDGGSEDEVTLRENREAFNKLIIRPRYLTDTHKIDLSVDLLGKKLAYPILLDPAGGKNCFFKGGEAAVARAAHNANALHITNGGIDSVLESGSGAAIWWQITTGGQLGDSQAMRAFIKKLESQGCSGICFSVDIMHVSHREREMRNKLERSWCESGLPARDSSGRLPVAKNPWRAGIYPERPKPTPTWATLAELCSTTKLPVMVKGILTAEDADRCVRNGAKAILVSNHGARQLDHLGSTIEALPEVVATVNKRIPVLVDGGFRRGTDILKALALGATAVGVARPYLYGLAAFGQRGAERVIELLRTELALDMALAGVANLGAIDRSLVRWKSEPRR